MFHSEANFVWSPALPLQDCSMRGNARAIKGINIFGARGGKWRLCLLSRPKGLKYGSLCCLHSLGRVDHPMVPFRSLRLAIGGSEVVHWTATSSPRVIMVVNERSRCSLVISADPNGRSLIVNRHKASAREACAVKYREAASISTASTPTCFHAASPSRPLGL